MKKVSIVMHFFNSEAETIERLTHMVDLGLLFKDVFGEFIAIRTPTQEFLEKRYANMDPNFLQFKLREITNRKKLIELLMGGANPIIIVDGNYTEVG